LIEHKCLKIGGTKMSQKWSKTGIKVKTGTAEGDFRDRSFNNLAEDATSEKIFAFAGIVAQLTGEPHVETAVTVSSELADEE
jgi:hypothetical protein